MTFNRHHHQRHVYQFHHQTIEETHPFSRVMNSFCVCLFFFQIEFDKWMFEYFFIHNSKQTENYRKKSDVLQKKKKT